MSCMLPSVTPGTHLLLLQQQRRCRCCNPVGQGRERGPPDHRYAWSLASQTRRATWPAAEWCHPLRSSWLHTRMRLLCYRRLRAAVLPVYTQKTRIGLGLSSCGFLVVIGPKWARHSRAYNKTPALPPAAISLPVAERWPGCCAGTDGCIPSRPPAHNMAIIKIHPDLWPGAEQRRWNGHPVAHAKGPVLRGRNTS